MKKLILLLLLCPVFLSAQNESLFKKGQITISAGVAGPNLVDATIDYSGLNISKGKSTPFFMSNITYGLSENMEAGLHLGYQRSTSKIGTATGLIGQVLDLGDFKADSHFSVTTVGVRVAVHAPRYSNNAILSALSQIKGVDVYIAGYLGYNFIDKSVDVITGEGIIDSILKPIINSVDYPPYTYSVNAGLNYSINKNLSIYGELGYGRFIFNAGVAYHL